MSVSPPDGVQPADFGAGTGPSAPQPEKFATRPTDSQLANFGVPPSARGYFRADPSAPQPEKFAPTCPPRPQPEKLRAGPSAGAGGYFRAGPSAPQPEKFAPTSPPRPQPEK